MDHWHKNCIAYSYQSLPKEVQHLSLETRQFIERTPGISIALDLDHSLQVHSSLKDFKRSVHRLLPVKTNGKTELVAVQSESHTSIHLRYPYNFASCCHTQSTYLKLMHAQQLPFFGGHDQNYLESSEFYLAVSMDYDQEKKDKNLMFCAN